MICVSLLKSPYWWSLKLLTAEVLPKSHFEKFSRSFLNQFQEMTLWHRRQVTLSHLSQASYQFITELLCLTNWSISSCICGLFHLKVLLGYTPTHRGLCLDFGRRYLLRILQIPDLCNFIIQASLQAPVLRPVIRGGGYWGNRVG